MGETQPSLFLAVLEFSSRPDASISTRKHYVRAPSLVAAREIALAQGRAAEIRAASSESSEGALHFVGIRVITEIAAVYDNLIELQDHLKAELATNPFLRRSDDEPT